MTPLPSSFVTTRESLRAIACFVISPARKARSGGIGLRPTGDGFGTSPFEDGSRIVVSGTDLVIEHGAGRDRREPITTLRAAAALVGLELAADPGVGHDLPPFRPDDHLQVDAGASLALGEWYAFGAEVLERLATGAHAANTSEAQLWPEHFDLAVTVEPAGGAPVNIGFSPGDSYSAEPYLYVGPHDTTGLAGNYWNAPFGAVVTRAQLTGETDPSMAASAFIDEGLRLLNAA